MKKRLFRVSAGAAITDKKGKVLLVVRDCRAQGVVLQSSEGLIIVPHDKMVRTISYTLGGENA